MLTTGLNALAMARLGGMQLIYGGGRDGMTMLLVGLSSIGTAILGVGKQEACERAKS